MLTNSRYSNYGEFLKIIKKWITSNGEVFINHHSVPNYNTPSGVSKCQCWQNTVTPMLSSHSILPGKKGPIWSISISAMYSECKAMQKQVPHSQKVWHTSEGFTRQACLKVGTDVFCSAFVAWVFIAYSSKCDGTHWCVHQTRHSRVCHDQQLFWQASANGHRCPWECKLKRRSI